MNNELSLKKEYNKYILSTIWKKSRICLIWLAIISAVIILWGEHIFPTKYVEIRGISYIIILLLPCILTKFPLNLIDSTYYGTIEKVIVKTSKDNEYLFPVLWNGLSTYSVNTIYLILKSPSGQIFKQKVGIEKANSQQYVEKYHEGDTVFHLYGTNQVIIFPKASDENIQCAVCGTINLIENKHCRKCNHTIIKQSHLFKLNDE